MKTHTSLLWRGDDAPAAVRIIMDFYKIGYTLAWHIDLDLLLNASPESWFSIENRCALLAVRDEQECFAAAGGLIGMQKQVDYGDPPARPLWVRLKRMPDRPGLSGTHLRRKGLGRAIVAALENKARDLGYVTSYLHADADAPASLGFWRSQRYSEFGRFS